MSADVFATAILREFPGLAPGYFDTAAIGPVPERARRAVAQVAGALGAGTRGSSAWHAITDRAVEAIAAEFEVDGDRVSFLASTGEAFNAVARAVPWRDGDEVLCFADDFPTVRLPWTALGDGVRLRQIMADPGDERTEAILRGIGGSTRVIAASHVHPATGTTVDLARVGAVCRERGILLVVDGAQSAGAVPIDLDGVDVFVGTGYKWLMSGFGVALVIVSESFRAQAVPTLLGYGNTPPSSNLVYGHQNLFGLAAIAGAAEVRRELGLSAIHARIHGLAHRLHGELQAAGWETAAEASRLAGIVSLRVADPAVLAAPLGDAGFAVAVRQGLVRFSPGFTTTDHDIENLLTAIGRLGDRFPIGAP